MVSDSEFSRMYQTAWSSTPCFSTHDVGESMLEAPRVCDEYSKE